MYYYAPFRIPVNTSRFVAMWYYLKMNKSDDYIIVTDAQNFGDDGAPKEEDTLQKEAKDLSLRALRMQGIFPADEEEGVAPPESSHDDFSKELLRESGIEIIKEQEDGASSS